MTIEANQAGNKTRVLSIQMPSMGHVVFGETLRRVLADSSVDFVARWTNDDPEFHARVLNKVLRTGLPFHWVRRRNLDFRRFRADLGYAYFARRCLDRVTRNHAVDVLHFHTQTLSYLALDYMQRFPSVVTIDQTGEQIAREGMAAWEWTHGPSRALESASFRRASAIVPFSRWAAESLVRSYDVPTEKIHVIPIGIDLAPFERIVEQRTRRADSEAFRILFVGNDFRRKGGDILLRIFTEHFADRNVELHLVTNDSVVPLGPKVIVHRGVAAFSPRWRALYAQADLFVLPTRAEAFGIVFVEAMAAGVPVIGTKINAVPEIVADGETGILIDPGDERSLCEAIERLIGDRERLRRLGDAGRKRAAALFDSKKTVAALERIFYTVRKAPAMSS